MHTHRQNNIRIRIDLYCVIYMHWESAYDALMRTCPILRTYTCVRVPMYVWLLFSFYLHYCICVFSHHFRHHGRRSDYLRSIVSLRVCIFCVYIRLFCGHILLILWITRQWNLLCLPLYRGHYFYVVTSLCLSVLRGIFFFSLSVIWEDFFVSCAEFWSLLKYVSVYKCLHDMHNMGAA